MNAWYNEIDPFAAQWIENLAAAGHVAPGSVDRRSVRDLGADDVPGERQCHFFAGIGGWSRALRLAGWPDELAVDTGSCPCQPFSSAGRGRGFDDERHLWPFWFSSIGRRRPPVVLGEQVASPAGLDWLDVVSTDLEGAGYEVGAADLCAAGVGAPHIRQRLFFVAVSHGERLERVRVHLRERRPFAPMFEATRSGEAGKADGMAIAGGEGRSEVRADVRGSSQRGDAARLEQRSLYSGDGLVGGFWRGAEWVDCIDGKQRPIEPGTFPLAHGISARVGRLRGYGNAISPEVGAAFIRSVMDWLIAT